MITALLRKDLRWIGALGAIAFVVHLLYLFSNSAGALWILPFYNVYEDYTGLFATIGIALGLFVGARDDLFRTREYLVFRPVSRRQLALARHLGWVAALALALVLPLCLHLAGTLLFADDTPLVEAGRLWPYVCVGGLVFPFYAAAYFAATSPRGRLQLVVLAIAPGLLLTVLYGSFLFHRSPPWSARPTATLLVALAMAALLLLAAEAQEPWAREADRPAPGRGTWLARLLVAGTLVILAAAGAQQAQQDLAGSVFGEGPSVLQRPDGTLTLGRRLSHPRRVFAALDGSGRETGERLVVPYEPSPAAPRFVYRPTVGRHSANPSGLPVLGRRRVPLLTNLPGVSIALDRTTGFVEVIERAASDAGGPSRRTVGKAPGPGAVQPIPFSAEALELRATDQEIVVADPADGGVWRFAPRGPDRSFTRVPLPPELRIESLSPHTAEVPQAPGRWLRVARTPSGAHVWLDGKLVPAADAAHPQLRTERLGPFTVKATITVGKESLTHTFAPTTSEQRALVWAVGALTTLRPPALNLVAAGAPHDPDYAFPDLDLRDPLLRAGARPGLLVASLALGVALSVLASLRLRRLGVGGARRLIWAVGVALGGLPVYVACWLYETRRAWQGVAAPAEEATEAPLIREAAPAA